MAETNMLCSKCGTKLGKKDGVVKCTGLCNLSYHAGCVAVKPLKGKTASEIIDWTCNDCKEKTDSDFELPKNPADNVEGGTNQSFRNSEAMKKIEMDRETFKSCTIDEKMEVIFKEIQEVKVFCTFLNDNYEEFKQQKCYLQQALTDVSKLKIENQLLANQVDDLTCRLNYMEQEQVSDTLVITGTSPQVSADQREGHEDLLNVVQTVANALELSVRPQDIYECKRMYSKDKVASVVVKFNNLAIKNKLIANRKKIQKEGRQLLSDKIGLRGPSKFVYVNTYLTLNTLDLFKYAKQLKSSGGFAHVWCQEGKVLARRHEKAKVEVIKSQHHVNLLMSQASTSST